jgi:hypothetical protein
MGGDATLNFGKNVPMKRPGQPELARSYVTLADPLSSYTSSATIAVTGGTTRGAALRVRASAARRHLRIGSFFQVKNGKIQTYEILFDATELRKLQAQQRQR